MNRQKGREKEKDGEIAVGRWFFNRSQQSVSRKHHGAVDLIKQVNELLLLELLGAQLDVFQQVLYLLLLLLPLAASATASGGLLASCADDAPGAPELVSDGYDTVVRDGASHVVVRLERVLDGEEKAEAHLLRFHGFWGLLLLMLLLFRCCGSGWR